MESQAKGTTRYGASSMFDKIISNITSFRRRGGMFTIAIRMLMVLTVVIGGICIAIQIWWFALTLVALLLSLLFYTLFRLFNFADKNPLVAILEGSELVRIEEARQAKKFEENLPASPPAIDHEPPPISEAEILAPDSPPGQGPPRLDSPPRTTS